MAVLRIVVSVALQDTALNMFLISNESSAWSGCCGVVMR